MNRNATVSCIVSFANPAYKQQKIEFNGRSNLKVLLDGHVGPEGFSSVASDLLDLGAAIFQIERQIKSRSSINRPVRFELSIKLREPELWTAEVCDSLENALALMGNAQWKIEVVEKLNIPVHTADRSKSEVFQIALFSGGLDSTCGVLTLLPEREITHLVSVYKVQKDLQKQIAETLGFTQTQCSLTWSGDQSRGRSFFYRSFFFLALSAAIASSWKARRILQFENGILATAIPPSPAFLMTKHAHPQLHDIAERIFSALFGGKWKIENPFLRLTKRQSVQRAREFGGRFDIDTLLARTETCWAYHSMPIIGKDGKRKPRRKSCGICIPCVVRRTSLPQENGFFKNICSDRIRNDAKMGVVFRSYFGFLDRVLHAANSPAEFYKILPGEGRTLFENSERLSQHEIQKLFTTFGNEFMETYKLKV